MRISDWSSDVCSSGLHRRAAGAGRQCLRHPAPRHPGADQGRGRGSGGSPEMSNVNHYDVILSPVITEKATRTYEYNQVTFKVPMTATKPQIKADGEALYQVKGMEVNRCAGRLVGKKSDS